MNLFAISGITGVATSALMATLMFARGKNKTHFIWGFFCVSVVIWDFGVFELARTINISMALFWWQIGTLGMTFIPVIFNHFVYIFLGIKNKLLIYSSYLIAIAFSLLLFIQPADILSMRWTFGQFYYNYDAGPFYIALTIFFFMMIGWGHYKLIRAYNDSSGLKKVQIKYFFIGTLVGFSGGSFNFLPAYGIYFYPILNFTIVLYPLIIGYAIIKHRLLDIRIVIRSFFIYLNVLLFSYLLFYVFVLASRLLFNGAFRIEFYSADWLLIPLLVLAVYLLDGISKKIANKYLFFGLYNYQSTINNLSKKLNNYIDLNKIINSIVNTIAKTMPVDHAGVLLVSGDKERLKFQVAKVVGFGGKKALLLARDPFLMKYLQTSPQPLVTEELAASVADGQHKKSESYRELSALLEQSGVSLCLPLLSNNKLIGLIILGLKLSGDAYSQEDLQLLSTLSYQAGIAISNAQFYKTVKDFNLVLQKKVDQQTRELRARAKILQAQNVKLNKLLEVKNEFLRLVNHQLNTPISIIKNAAYMMENKKFDEVKGISFINEGVRRMEGVLKDFWDAFAVEGEGIKLNFVKTDLAALIDKLADDARRLDTAKNKGLEIKIVRSDSLPSVKTDPVQLSQVISNLLDNAIAYTPAGSIIFSLRIAKNNFVKVSITDSGYGMDKNEKKRIFEKFYRGDRARQYRPGGSGLGLYIAQKIIRANGGILKLEKSEVGKGTTFSFTVPIWK
ncbi:MAG TPA: ATP-binding protein [Candidatus Nanoarchaeia archaeon]|nr:ATP-binding protein [Candidatus Nanoarchaeia archaeon]